MSGQYPPAFGTFYPPPPAPPDANSAYGPGGHQYPQSPMAQAVQPPQVQQPPVSGALSDKFGSFDGEKGSYRIDHRDCNSLLTLRLADMGCVVYGKPGAMVAMSPSITLKGNLKFSMRKFLTGGELAQSTYAGPGEILIAPPALGDIVPIRLDGKQTWSLGRDGHLAHTQGVKCEMKSQGFTKAMFSGEGLFVIKVSGEGILFITSLGAIIQKDLAPQENYVVDNDHLVAWNCKYNIERVTSGGILSSVMAQEGLVCKFTGPGTVFFQTRNPTAFGAWIASHMGAGGR
ncbi:tryptophan RNA-binding attenuator protein-like domain-containing protein [Terfezia claveryi]|nr:tryptophan RNA-binding attenuator protein-like domain-containing protein [Terfezia claveryi]